MSDSFDLAVVDRVANVFQSRLARILQHAPKASATFL
jgi:hypothetical protein